MRKKIVVFSHNDLDGLISGLLFEFISGLTHEVLVYYCDVHEVDSKFRTYLDTIHSEDVDFIFMTDISLKDEWLIQRVDKELSDKFLLIDHHQSITWMNKYKWSHVEVYHDKERGIKSCGATLVLNYLMDGFNWGRLSEKTKDSIQLMVSDVRDFDVWDWEKNCNVRAKHLNDLFNYHGLEDFRKLVLEKEFDMTFTYEDKVRVETIEKLNNDYVQERVNSATRDDGSPIDITLNGSKLILVSADRLASRVGQEVSKKFPDYEGVCVVSFSNKTVGFYSHRDDVDLTKVAVYFGGGGHPKACGCQLTSGLAMLLMGSMYCN